MSLIKNNFLLFYICFKYLCRKTIVSIENIKSIIINKYNINFNDLISIERLQSGLNKT